MRTQLKARSESKKTGEILRESEERYRELVNSLPNIVFETDMNGQVVFANKMAYETSGYSQSEVEKGVNIMQVLTPEGRERAMENIQRLLAGGPSFPIEYTFVRKDGTTLPALITTALIICQNKVTGLRGLVIDITERKNAEEIVRKSEERYRKLANSLPEIVFETDLNGKITFFNQRALEITGLTREEFENGMNMLSFVVPEDRERAAVNMKKSMTGENLGSNEYTLSRKNGTTFPALVSTSPIISENKVSGLRGLVIDITERKKAEEALNRAMDELVLVNEKLNVMGRLTRHDIRNKLTGIGGSVHILKKTHSDCADIMQRLDTMEQASKSIMKILDFAKMYEELGSKELYFVDVEKTVDESVALFSAPPKVKIINECHGLTVLADSFLRQLFYNLIDNSIKHGKRATKILARYEKVDQDKLNLIYEDDGVGVSTDNKSKLFKEGFSTSGSTGYGLNLIKKTMDVYGWAIQENGEPDKGARFTITIPRLNKSGKENFRIT